MSPLSHGLGFTPLPWLFFTALVVFTIVYLVLVEVTKTVFYADPMHLAGQPTAPATMCTAFSGAPPASAMAATIGHPNNRHQSSMRTRT